jgi:YVTN family beta-propeller protein
MDLVAFGLTIDSLRVAAIRPVADTVVDTTVFFDPNAASLSLALPVPLRTASETFIVLLELRAGRRVLFTGLDTVQVSAGAPDTSSTATIALKYAGPGSGLTRIRIAPVDSVLTEGQTKQFSVTADSNGVPVDSFYVSWSTSDTAAAPINGIGVLHAPNARGAVFVRAVTPNGVRDSTRVTFIPVPNAVVAVTGDGQSGSVGTRLPLPLRARVTASDGLGVAGIVVRFLAPPGGSVRDSVVITDSAGFAEDSVTLPTVTGPQIFQAIVTGLPAASFSATVTAGAIAAGQSVVSVSTSTVASGGTVTLTLQGKDAFGNNVTSGGAVVAFTASGGTSTGSIGPTTDHADGTYTAPFTGGAAGTATTIGATVNGTAVGTTLPTITVSAGAISPATSVVTSSSPLVTSGASATLTLQAKDSAGNDLATGGATVVFTATGGTSTGTIGSTIDHGDGTYTASFTAESAGTATTIGATVNGVSAASTAPLTVVPGNTVAARSVITVSVDTILSGGTATLTLQARDSVGNDITTGGLTVVFNRTGGTSTGNIGATTDHGDGTYTAVFTGMLAGTPTTIGATVDGALVTSTLPTITVRPGAISAATSLVTVSDSVIGTGAVDTLFLQAKDAAGNLLSAGGATVVFTQSGGTSVGAIGATTDLGNGKYRALFTGQTAGTPTTIGATVNAAAVTTSLPVIRVFSVITTHSADITADESWLASQNPHVVTGYLRVRNGATLSIGPGALVKFDAGAGLQVGDTALGQTGGLAMDGTTAGITLTANTASPTPGFWKGIEVQRGFVVPAWRNALIEWGGGTRAPAGAVAAEACVLLDNASGAALELDSLHIRQCNHAAIHLFGGSAHVHRLEIDSVTGSGIHVDFDGQLELDSTVIRGAGQEGLFFGSTTARLVASSGNQLRNNFVTGIHLTAFQLPGLLKQDSIVGNGTNVIVVDGGQPDPSVAAFTMFAQPQPAGQDGYRIQNASLDVGRVGGQVLTLDSNVVLRFNGQTGLWIGDSAGTRSGALRALATNPSNRAVLTSATGAAPGLWVGVEIGRLSGPDTLRYVRIDNAGDSVPGRTMHRVGLWIRHPTAGPLVVDGARIAGNGASGSPKNSAGIAITGTGGTEIRNSVLFQNLGFGIALADKGFKIVNDTIDTHTIGIAAFMEGGAQLTAADSIDGNTFPNTQYAVSLTAAALRALHSNAITTALSDTLLFDGGLLTADATLPTIPGYVWRATRTTTVDQGATFTVAPGDTVAFDTSAGIVVGQTAPAALAADGGTGPILFTASGPLPQGWRGIDFHRMSGSGSTTNNKFRHVDVDRAGFIAPCFGECSPVFFGALRFTDSIATTDVNLAIDHLILRRSNSIALDFQRGGTGTVSVASSEFYQNKPDPMIRARFGHANQLTITGSDLYHYRGWVIQSSYRSGSPTDSVLAANNWWGDVLGADTGFLFQDTLGRTTTQFYAAVTTPFATTPFFPVGPATGVVTTVDSLLSSTVQNDSVSIHARVVDARGRGVAGQSVTWTPIPASPASFITPTSSLGDIGGRVNAQWNFTNIAGRLTAHATGGGGFTDYFIDVAPGATTASNWTFDMVGSQGQVTGAKSITFTSANRTGVIVTHSHDSFNNATQFFSGCFDIIGGTCSFFPQPGVFDSVHTSGGVDGDTVFFHATANTPSPFVIRASYNGFAGLITDSVVVTMTPNVAGVKIDRDPYGFNGIQTAPDTALFNAICPTGQPTFYCQVEYHAYVVDSGLVPFGNQNARFQWTLVPAAGAPVSVATRGTPANDSALVTALTNGFVRLVVTDTSASDLGSDTMPVLVQQTAYNIIVSPDTASVLIGGTATYNGAAVDPGGDTLATAQVHWRPYDPFNTHITIVDTSVANQVTVRLDSTPFGYDYVEAFTVNPAGDTVFGTAQITNPVLKQLPVGLQPWAIAVNSQTHAVYAGHQGGQLYKVDGSSDAVVDSATPGLTIAAVAVNPITNRVYAATNGGVAVLDGSTLATITTVLTGANSPGVTNRQGVAIDSVNNRIFVTVAPPGASPLRVLRQIDGATNTFSALNDVSLPDTGAGAVFNPADGMVYVAIPNGNAVVVVDPTSHSIAASIPVGATPTFVAVNPATNRVYVTNAGDNTLSVIDAVTGTVIQTVDLFYNLGAVTVDVPHNRVYVGATSPYPYLLVVNGATNIWDATILAGDGTFADGVWGAVVDGNIGNGRIFTANYTTSTVARLAF